MCGNESRKADVSSTLDKRSRLQSSSSCCGSFSSIMTGAWSLVCSHRLGLLTTLANLSDGAIAGLSRKWSIRSPASRSNEFLVASRR